MRVFISWSGDVSLQVGKGLKSFLENTFPGHVHAFLSDGDIAPGERFNEVITDNLDEATLGILLVTPESMTSPWLLFEAGALASKSPRGSVIPVLLGVERDALLPPLNQFQNVVGADQKGFASVCARIRTSVNMPTIPFERLFAICWPEFEVALRTAAEAPSSSASVQRPLEDMVAEILLTVTALANHSTRAGKRYADPAIEGASRIVKAIGAANGLWGSSRMHPGVGKVINVDVRPHEPTQEQLQAALAEAVAAGNSYIVETGLGGYHLDPRLEVVQPLFDK